MSRNLVVIIVLSLVMTALGCSTLCARPASNFESATSERKELLGGIEAYVPNEWTLIGQSDGLIEWDLSNNYKALASCSFWPWEETGFDPAFSKASVYGFAAHHLESEKRYTLGSCTYVDKTVSMGVPTLKVSYNVQIDGVEAQVDKLIFATSKGVTILRGEYLTETQSEYEAAIERYLDSAVPAHNEDVYLMLLTKDSPEDIDDAKVDEYYDYCRKALDCAIKGEDLP